MKKVPLGAVLIGMIACSVAFGAHSACALMIGDPFPAFTQVNTLSEDECTYLSIDCGKDFALADLAHEVMIVEFLNVYCHTCRLQVPVFNELQSAVDKDPEMKGRVCVIGIAVGNSAEEVQDFKKTYGVRYPVLTDQKKDIFNRTGNIQGTPHTYVLRRDDMRFIVDYHAGSVSSPDRYLASVRFAMRGILAGTEPGNKAVPFSFSVNGTTCSEKTFAGQKVIMYFPVDRQYELAMDSRNTANQIAVLTEIKEAYPSIPIVVAPAPGVTVADSTALIIARREYAGMLKSYGRPDEPALYVINEYGRVSYKGEAMTLWNARGIIEGRDYKPVPDMSEQDIRALLEQAVVALGHESAAIEKHAMDNRSEVFVVTLAPLREGRFLFARLASDPSLCDICHDSHFLYLFDQEGTIVDFVPVQLTKLGNIPWSEQDVQKIKGLVCGKNIMDTFPFNPKYDAVTTATMTSSVVFESLNRAKKLFGDFKEYAFRRGHWKEICHETMCMLKVKAEQQLREGSLTAIDQNALKSILAETGRSACPLDGIYLWIDGGVLCSIHGLSAHDCGSAGRTKNTQP
jgi:peroxiredoxin